MISRVAVSMFMMLVAQIALANEYIGILQFSHPSGMTQLVFQTNVVDMKNCRDLNDYHWRGVKTTCPTCKLEESLCTKKMPASYEGLIKNERTIVPYLSSQDDRIVYFGVKMTDAINACKKMESGYIEKLNRPAKCIMPLDQ